MTTRRKLRLGASIALSAYAIIEQAVEAGVAYGWRRAHKHADAPDEDMIRDAIKQAVMVELCEVVRFDDG